MARSDYVDDGNYKYIKASGAAANDCMVLGYRTLCGVPFSPFEMESWVIHFRPEGAKSDEVVLVYEYGKAGWLTGLWRSEEGTVYVADSEGLISTWRDLGPQRREEDAWEEVKLDARLRGVWGLSDECVFTWGRVGEDYRMFRYD